MYNLTNMYDEKFFVDNLEDSKPIADYLAPIIVKKLGIKTILDYGCATGHWLNSFKLSGVDDAKGIEGSKSILKHLIIPNELVYDLDLRFPLYKQQINIAEKIDLAFSFEVAEHIEEVYSDIFVDNLVLWQPKYVMLTAAPPGQGGLGHVNEKPKDYWFSKFTKRGYTQNVELETFFTEEIENARRLTDVSGDLQRPDMASICPRFVETAGCEKGVWVPPWLPKNLMVVKRDQE